MTKKDIKCLIFNVIGIMIVSFIALLSFNNVKFFATNVNENDNNNNKIPEIVEPVESEEVPEENETPTPKVESEKNEEKIKEPVKKTPKEVIEIKEEKVETPSVKEVVDTPSTPSEDIPKVKTLKEINADLIKEIYDLYGYNVSYGDDQYCYSSKPCTFLTDEEKANETLKTLKKKSAEFPQNFFRTIKDFNGYRVELYANIPGAAGVASYEFGDDNKLLLDVNQGLVGRTFYHETWHIMEKYISFKSYGKPDPFANWNSLNPSGFNYATTEDRIYTTVSYDWDTRSYPTSISEIAFISTYAKSAPWEDRTELFADLMFRPVAKDYMASGFGVNEKAKALALIIREFFPNSNGANCSIKW